MNIVLVISMLTGLTVQTLFAEVKLHALFSDHAVLQHGQPLPVWGTANEGEKVTVDFAGQSETTTAKDGRWMIRLKPMKANATPQDMSVSGENTITIKDLLVGDVWICSGQSNMEFKFSYNADANRHISAANDPLLRLMTIPRVRKAEPQQDVAAAWTLCTSKSVSGFSAVGYFFGRDLRKERGIPVGLIDSSLGGTSAQLWTGAQALMAEPLLKPIIDGQLKAAKRYEAALEKFNKDEPQLLEKWKAEVEIAKAEGKKEPKKPKPPTNSAAVGSSSLYNAMIAPLQPFAIAGVIWYQGESDANAAKQYQILFPTLIQCWRDGWKMPSMPFLFVQITPCTNQPPEIREAQLLTWKKVPHTAMVVTTDCAYPADPGNIHPGIKEPVGARLALSARAVACGEKIEYSGPVYESFKVDGNRVIVSFSHVGDGLLAKGGELKGFTIAGLDKKFVEAVATIEGDKVVVTSTEVEKPVAVRYGWANVPDVNLFNKIEMPASPFRTDVE